MSVDLNKLSDKDKAVLALAVQAGFACIEVHEFDNDQVELFEITVVITDNSTHKYDIGASKWVERFGE